MDTKAKELWAKLADVSVDNEECIEQEFLNFPVGTHREEIWHWFEDHFEISVATLMYGHYQQKL